jgi:hypothetical protein
MASMYVQYAIRNVETGKFVRYMSDDGAQYMETDNNDNFVVFENEFQAHAYLNEKVKWIDSSCYFEVVKLYVVTPY